MNQSSDGTPVYFIREPELVAFRNEIDRGPLFATVAGEEGRSHFERIEAERMGEIALRCEPAVEAVKSFLFPAKEKVATYPGGASEPETGLSNDAPQILLGIRACDLAAIRILDQVLGEGEFEDPFYLERRNATLLISVDCVMPAETCFCNLVGGKPYSEGGVCDLNLTPVEGGYAVGICSEGGRELVVEQAHSFQEADAAQLRERERVRAECMARLEEQNAAYKPRRPIEEVLGEKGVSPWWLRLAAACVECGGCSYVCPTCHCFMLYDQFAGREEGVGERIKGWDSCLFGSFARMAGVGGVKGTPRPDLPLRFENRIRHKFEWMPENLGKLGCVGCGRCSEVCMGGRDVREVIKEIGG